MVAVNCDGELLFSSDADRLLVVDAVPATAGVAEVLLLAAPAAPFASPGGASAPFSSGLGCGSLKRPWLACLCAGCGCCRCLRSSLYSSNFLRLSWVPLTVLPESARPAMLALMPSLFSCTAVLGTLTIEDPSLDV